MYNSLQFLIKIKHLSFSFLILHDLVYKCKKWAFCDSVGCTTVWEQTSALCMHAQWVALNNIYIGPFFKERCGLLIACAFTSCSRIVAALNTGCSCRIGSP